MKRTLTSKFFNRPTLAVARDLLGTFIVRRTRGRETALMITEVEAYDGPRDLASHASRGMTARTSIMFGPAGLFYIYFTYGIHWMVNIVTGPPGYPAAILLRAGMYRNLKTGHNVHVTGPARLTKFLKIDGRQNKKPAIKKTGLWFEDRGMKVHHTKVIPGKRIGVDYAGRIWSAKLYNFKFLTK
jgi:DNA-3-methyladenine glycosylase